jgi:acetylornithine deacetylase/succinyl-diaminopimelate desuccinylase-like protein
MDKRIIEPFVTNFFDKEIIPALSSYIRIDNCSPSYDANWNTNGKLEEAAIFLKQWVESQNLKNCNVNIIQEKNRTPFIYIDIPSTKENDDRSILLYGHFDKQPPLEGWSEGLGPRKPVIKDNHLYGRGGADDGYAIFSTITAVKCAQDNNWPLPKIDIIIEGAEESYTYDLEFYVNFLSEEIGIPSLIVCMDSGCQDYKRLWVTGSLRGVVSIDLKISVLEQGVHSGVFGGMVPDSFMILRNLLDRIEDPLTGKILIQELYADIPNQRLRDIDKLVEILGDDIIKNIPFEEGVKPFTNDIKQLIINNTWKPFMAITGADGIPDSKTAGNVLRPYTQIKISIRLPPLVDSKIAADKIVEILKKDPPYNSKVEASVDNTGDGWNLETFGSRLKNISSLASQRFFDNNDMAFTGEGGSVPFVQILNKKFPKSDFMVLGVTGPGCNIHALDENLNLDFCKRVIMSLTYILSEY